MKSIVDLMASQQRLKLFLIKSTFDWLRSSSKSKRVPKSETANKQRITKSVSKSSEFPAFISRTKSGRACADSFHRNFKMLKIRSERLSGEPCRLIRTNISRTSASDFRSGL